MQASFKNINITDSKLLNGNVFRLLLYSFVQIIGATNLWVDTHWVRMFKFKFHLVTDSLQLFSDLLNTSLNLSCIRKRTVASASKYTPALNTQSDVVTVALRRTFAQFTIHSSHNSSISPLM